VQQRLNPGRTGTVCGKQHIKKHRRGCQFAGIPFIPYIFGL
jgi:hypothetical protein